MNSDYHQRLETEIDRELKRLPELTAPATLTARVLARMEKRSARPWYRQAWPAWSKPAQALSLAAMLGVFGAICLVGWQSFQGAEAGLVGQKLAGWFSGPVTVWNAAGAILRAILLALGQLGNGILIGCFFIVLCNYLACVGLGTVAVRFALARSRRNQSHL